MASAMTDETAADAALAGGDEIDGQGVANAVEVWRGWLAVGRVGAAERREHGRAERGVAAESAQASLIGG